MDPKNYFEFMSKLVNLADEYGLSLICNNGNTCNIPEEFDLILEFVVKGFE